MDKRKFFRLLTQFVSGLKSYVETTDGQWSIKGFIDAHRNVYTISSDTKIISKILEIHLFPKIKEFADANGFEIELASKQNYYPDLSFIYKEDRSIMFAVDLKTTYRNPDNPEECNGFTLGSHGEYFIHRKSNKNIQHPYSKYKGHFCLGIIYNREKESNISETETKKIGEVETIVSVIRNFQFFFAEKWKIASDKSGSGNTANIGSIKNINQIIAGKGMFTEYRERLFDEYWMSYGKNYMTNEKGEQKKITSLKDYLVYRGIKK